MKNLTIRIGFLIVVPAVIVGGIWSFGSIKSTRAPLSPSPQAERRFGGEEDAARTPPPTPRMRGGELPRGKVALAGTVPTALRRAKKISSAHNGDERLTLTLVLKRTDQPAFDQFVRDVQNPQSPSYRQYLVPGQQADRFGPAVQTYEEVNRWLTDEGFRVSDGSLNRLTITFSGTRAQAEKTFEVRLEDYRLGDRTFYANEREPQLPANIASGN